jgi:hypothetical protein
MTSIFDPLVEIIHSRALDSWKDRNEKTLSDFFGGRYPKRAEKAVALRAPDMRGSDSGVPYAAYIHPSNADAGAYGGIPWTMPMDQFFEAWVETIVRHVAQRTGGVLKSGRRRETVSPLSLGTALSRVPTFSGP